MDTQRLVISVGGTRFETTRATLARAGASSPLARLGEPEPDGVYFFDRDPVPFALFLAALRAERQCAPGAISSEEEAFWTGAASVPQAQTRQERKRARTDDVVPRFVVGERVTVNGERGVIAQDDGTSDSPYRVRYDLSRDLSAWLGLRIPTRYALDAGTPVRVCVNELIAGKYRIGVEGVVTDATMAFDDLASL